MKNIFKPRNTISAIDVEIENLTKRRAEIATRLGDAELALNQAREDRREGLATNGDFDAATIRIRELTNQIADLITVLDDVDLQFGIASERLAKARDSNARSIAAAALDQVAVSAELRIPELEKAISSLSKTVLALRTDLDGAANYWETHHANRPLGSLDRGAAKATAREVAAAVVAEVLARAMPWAFDVGLSNEGYRSGLHRIMTPQEPRPNWSSDRPTEPLDGGEIINALICAPLRQRASEIREGVSPTDKP